MRTLLPVLVLLAAAAPQEPAAPAQDMAPFRLGAPDVVLLVTGGLGGDLAPKGLAHRAGLVRRYRSAFPRTVLVDAGDAFSGDPHDARNRFVPRAYRELGYDALALGAHEWTAPLRDLRAWLSEGGPSWLSSTVAPKEGAPLPLAREVKREWGGLRLALVSDVRGDAPLRVAKRRLAELAFAPPARLREDVAALKAAAFVVVAVVPGDDAQAERSARGCEADLLLQLNRADAAGEPAVREVAGRRVVRIAGGAGSVDVVALKVRGGRIAAVEHRHETVDERWPADPRLRATGEAWAAAPRPVEPPAERTPGLAYVPASACGDCHQIEHDAWKKRRHAQAYATLAEVGRANEARCLVCHATGATTTQGFRSRERTPDLANVNCQVCHRLGIDEHGGGGFNGDPPDAKLCRECHTKATDPEFDFAKRSARVGCVAK